MKKFLTIGLIALSGIFGLSSIDDNNDAQFFANEGSLQKICNYKDYGTWLERKQIAEDSKFSVEVLKEHLLKTPHIGINAYMWPTKKRLLHFTQDPEKVAFLLDEPGINVDAKDWEGNTPLILAVQLEAEAKSEADWAAKHRNVNLAWKEVEKLRKTIILLKEQIQS